MRDDGDGRHCERCQTRVTNVADLDAAQLDALVDSASRGRVCARFELVGAHPRLAAGLAAGLVVAALTGCVPSPALRGPDEPYNHVIEVDGEHEGSWIGGVVRDHDGQPVANALVVLSSDALPAQLERVTSARGVFGFGELAPGWYTIDVLTNASAIKKVIELPVDVRFRIDFRVDTAPRILGMLNLEDDVGSSASTLRISMD